VEKMWKKKLKPSDIMAMIANSLPKTESPFTK
jgi:hypothetical protein